MDLVARNAQPSIDPTTSDDAMRRWMQASRLETYSSAVQNIQQLQSLGIPFDLLAVLWIRLPSALAECRDADAVFESFVRYIRASRSPQAVATLFEREASALPMLLQAMAISPSISETLINDPEAFELLRITDGQPVLRQSLIDELRAEVAAARDDGHVQKTLQRFRQREVLRIAFGQFLREVSAEETFRQLSYLAESILQSAFERAHREIVTKCGQPIHPNGTMARCCILAVDRLGAAQQGYDNSIRLLLLAETNGRTDASRIIANTDFFDRLSNCFLDYLSGQPPGGSIYRIQIVKPLPIKTESHVVDVTAAFQHYDLRGRTWERQVFAQAQPIAGDLSLGNTFLQQLQPWIYRRYLSDADIAGLGANQRKLQRRLTADSSHRSGAADDRGASDDIEQMVLFLQLLHGHESPNIRVGNTFSALDRLTETHFLRESERTLLQTNYQLFRRAEAIRFFHSAASAHYSTSEERRQIAEAVEVTKRVIGSRLEESFPESQQTSAETDLILDPQPISAWINIILTSHRFAKPAIAYQHLMQLSEENVAVLSTRRCRYYLSLIAPTLLRAISQTTDPDQTLANLARMSNSLGGKGILWELLASSPATMQLIVRLNAYGSYLVSLLTHSPGMIDELMDSLLVDRLPRRDELELTLAEQCRGADDVDRVLHEFKNSMHLRVGVRDILGKESIMDTHRALSDIAEVCISRIVNDEYKALVSQFGFPFSSIPSQTISAYSVLALGKLGGQEPNYHSDLSFVLLFDHDGMTQHKAGSRANGTTVRHFFEQLAQRVMRRTNRVTHSERLYELDVRFGPLGKSGVLAMQLDQFVEYFHNGEGSVVERQSLCKARPIAGTQNFSKRALQAIAKLIQSTPFCDEDIASILAFRSEIQSSAKVHNLKRGEGGTVDIECLVQLMQLAHAHDHPEILVPGTLEAIGLLEQTGILEPEDARRIHDGYCFLREIEAALRLMNATARHDLPDETKDLDRLGVLLDSNSGLELKERTNEIRAIHREIFERLTSRSIKQ